MRRATPFLAIIVVMVQALAGSPLMTVVHAQDATPASDEVESQSGSTFTTLGIALGETLPTLADLEMARVNFLPGFGFAFDASDPVGAMIYVEAGELTIRVEEESWQITRAAARETAIASATNGEQDLSSAMEDIAQGEEGVLHVGDVAYVPGSLTGELRNNGQETVELFVVQIAPSMMDNVKPETKPAS